MGSIEQSAGEVPSPGEQPSFLIEIIRGTRTLTWASFSDGWFADVAHARFRPKPFFVQIDDHRVCVLGNPILGECIDKMGAAKLVARGASDSELSEINGEFLLIHADVGNRTLRAINCRFAYPTLYYAVFDDLVVLGTTFADVWERLASLGRAQLDTSTVFDFLNYKRVFGDKTPEKNTKLLVPSSIIEIKLGSTKVRQYWRPNFKNKSRIGVQDAATLLLEGVRGSLRRRTSEEGRYSLFLSGGMDTRLLLSSLESIGKEFTCFTIAAFENREVRVAKEAAAMVGMPHVFVAAPETHYQSTFARAARVGAGQYVPMCMFIGLEEQIAPYADIGFHGHGFDYFFQGMYLPRWNPRIGGHTLFFRLPQHLPTNIVGHFANSISYRVRPDHDFFDAAFRKQEEERLRAELDSIYDEALDVADEPTDVWEYLSFSNLARHYSCADHWGINTLLEQRTPSFDNDLYHLYQTLPSSLRFDARIQRTALTLASPQLANLAAANHRFPIRYSSARRTVSQIEDFALRRLGLREEPGDDRFERMGIPYDHLLKTQWKPFLEDFVKGPSLEALDFLQRDRLRVYVKDILASPALPDYGTSQVLVGLLTIDQLLRRL
ncbi:MAG: asparagine synthase-related protein [Alphaproteobacteria bacterium]